MKNTVNRGKSIAALTVGIVTFLLVPAITSAPAWANKALLKSMSLTIKPGFGALHVISNDGKKWNKFKPGNIPIWAHMKIDTRWPGYVKQYGIVLGACGGNLCTSFPLIWQGYSSSGGRGTLRDINQQTNIMIPTSKIPISTTGIALLPDGDQIISRCNQNRSANGPTKKYSFIHRFYATLVAHTDAALNPLGQATGNSIPVVPANFPGSVHYSRKASFDVKVVCDPVKKPPQHAGDVAIGQPQNLKVTGIELFRTTYSGAYTQPNPGTKCPKLKLLVRVKTNKKGKVKFKLWKKVGNGAMTSKVIDAWSSHDGNGFFKAEYTEWVSVSKTSFVQARAEELVSAIGKTTPWKEITLYCKGTGGAGGFAADTNKPDGNEPLKPKLTAAMSIADTGGTKCPRLGQVDFKVSFKGNIYQKDVPYKLRCTKNGVYQSGILHPVKQGSTYTATGKVMFQNTKTGLVRCNLYGQKGKIKGRIIATATRHFACVNRQVDPVAGDLTGGSRPTHSTGANSASDVKVAPPKQTCRNVTKKICKRVPKRTCRTVFKKKCTRVPKRVCSKTTTMVCSNKRIRSCKLVRGKRVCTVKTKRICRPITKTKCKTVLKRQCGRVAKQICTTGYETKCHMTSKRVCANSSAN